MNTKVKRKSISRLTALALTLCLLLVMAIPTLAASVPDATIHTDAACSITLYKYDRTSAAKDGVYDDSYVSTGVADAQLEQTLGGGTSTAHHNGTSSNGYALQGVEFSYVRVATVVTDTRNGSVSVLYAFPKATSGDLLAAIGLTDGAQSDADAAASAKLDGANNYYYSSEVLNKALAAALEANSTAVKNVLEAYVTAHKGADASVGGAMPLTDANGKSSVTGLKTGLYLMVETKVPEMVISTTAPFFVSLPMTSVNGTNASDGGSRWIYDVTLYPKNDTGIATLEKQVREAGSTAWSHNATGSSGDTMEYAILSTLPCITSSATALSEYTFHDVLSSGLTYVKDDVKMEWFASADCSGTAVGTWAQTDGMFTASYSTDNQEMYIRMTDAGLAAINATGTGLHTALSNYTVRITYSAKINSDSTFSYGDAGNDNIVSLTWRRSNGDCYDMLYDDAHVYSYGMDLAKIFREEAGVIDPEQAAADCLYEKVHFKLQNETDGYYVQAAFDAEDGVYYVTGHTDSEADATILTTSTAYPSADTPQYGRLIVKGLEDDAYVLTEVATASGYTLLRDSIRFTISAAEDAAHPCDVYVNEAKLGVYQNDGRYYFEGCPDLPLSNIPQPQLAHNLLTASATVDGDTVTMHADTDPATGADTASVNALVQLTVYNTRGYDLPATGDFTSLLLPTIGTLVGLSAAALFGCLLYKSRKAARTER